MPRDQVTLLSSEADITTYTFNKHVIKHRFCKLCGVQPFGEGIDPKGKKMAAINIRCIEGSICRRCPYSTSTAKRCKRAWSDTSIYAPALAGFLGVALGAFAAHALKARLAPEMLAVFETGVRYQLYHSFALCAAAWGYARWPGRRFTIAGVGISRGNRSSFPGRCISRRDG